VKLSKDGIAFLLHDATLERTTTGRGRSCDQTWAELAILDAGRWHSDGFRDERVPSFEEAARLLQSRETRINVEIKPSPGFEVETGRQVAAAAAALWKGAEVPPLLSSFSFEALMAAREAAPELPARIPHEGHRPRRLVPARPARSHRGPYRPPHPAPRKPGEGAREGAACPRLYRERCARAESLFESGVDSIVTDNLAEFARRFPESLGLVPRESGVPHPASPKGEVILRSTNMAQYGKKAQSKVKRAMHKRKAGTLKSGRSGKTVKSRKQAIAIGLSEARKAGAKVPRKKKSSSKKSSSKKSRKS
jgi:hypothetical protein